MAESIQTPEPAAQAESIHEHIVEIVSDSGEGAQKAGQTFGTISAKMGNGVWTVEIIPAEIQPPARSPAGASGIRIRLASRYITNMGDEADVVVAFNEQVLYSRIANGAYQEGHDGSSRGQMARRPGPGDPRAVRQGGRRVPSRTA